MFSVFREYKNIVTGVTLWGISDKYTWKDNFPVKGRKDWPLIFKGFQCFIAIDRM